MRRMRVLLLLATAACAPRAPAVHGPVPERFTVNATPEQIANAAARELNSIGFQLVSVDRTLGRVFARAEPDKQRALIRCQSEDNAARLSNAAFEINVYTEQVADRNTVTISAGINARRERIECVSTGELEARIARAVRAS